MLKIMHRVNTIEWLKNTDTQYWVEIDLRAWKNTVEDKNIILNHEPFEWGVSFEEYLEHYKHAFMILNVKEDGIEEIILELLKKHNIEEYFFLDAEFPFIYRYTKEWNKKVAIRYSEAEVIEQALAFKSKADYLWIDTNTTLPIYKDIIEHMKWFTTCLVSPDRWGRPEDIVKYKKQMENLNFELDMVMVWEEAAHLWD